MSFKYQGATIQWQLVMPDVATVNVAQLEKYCKVAKDLNCNAIRFALMGNGGGVRTDVFEQWLSTLAKYNLKAVPHGLSWWIGIQQFINFIKSYDNDDRILLWEITNEPDLSSESQIRYISQVYTGAKNAGVTKKLTVSGWHNGDRWQHPADFDLISPYCDIISWHFYGGDYYYDLVTGQRLSVGDLFQMIKSKAAGRPLWLSEWGYSQYMDILDPAHAYYPDISTALQDIFAKCHQFNYEGVLYFPFRAVEADIQSAIYSNFTPRQPAYDIIKAEYGTPIFERPMDLTTILLLALVAFMIFGS